MGDAVKNPNHYQTFPEMEAIDIIRIILTEEEYVGYCKGNYLKYKLRVGLKDDVNQEVAKANVYREWLFSASER